jgi:HEPN domain-containing protein
MPNKTYALEWILLANRNLETARLLLRENHFTDIIALELQQTIEKLFKAIYAFYGTSIPRTHSLPLLHNFVSERILLNELDIDDLITISDYYETDRYPGPRYMMPSRTEVENFFLVTENLFEQINQFINAED